MNIERVTFVLIVIFCYHAWHRNVIGTFVKNGAAKQTL